MPSIASRWIRQEQNRTLPLHRPTEQHWHLSKQKRGKKLHNQISEILHYIPRTIDKLKLITENRMHFSIIHMYAYKHSQMYLFKRSIIVCNSGIHFLPPSCRFFRVILCSRRWFCICTWFWWRCIVPWRRLGICWKWWRMPVIPLPRWFIAHNQTPIYKVVCSTEIDALNPKKTALGGYSAPKSLKRPIQS